MRPVTRTFRFRGPCTGHLAKQRISIIKASKVMRCTGISAVVAAKRRPLSGPITTDLLSRDVSERCHSSLCLAARNWLSAAASLAWSLGDSVWVEIIFPVFASTRISVMSAVPGRAISNDQTIRPFSFSISALFTIPRETFASATRSASAFVIFACLINSASVGSAAKAAAKANPITIPNVRLNIPILFIRSSTCSTQKRSTPNDFARDGSVLIKRIDGTRSGPRDNPQDEQNQKDNRSQRRPPNHLEKKFGHDLEWMPRRETMSENKRRRPRNQIRQRKQQRNNVAESFHLRSMRTIDNNNK